MLFRSHYFWDLQRGNPNIISKFPKPETVIGYTDFKPNAETLINETVNYDYIVKTQKPDYESDPRYKDDGQRPAFIEENKLRFLRKYQVRAIERIQEEVKEGKDRFLFEMATGTGKTLTAAAVIKLFLRTGNASEDGKPTFQYSLLHGVRDGFLVNPCVVDARTEITTQLLNDEGYMVQLTDEDGEETSTTFSQRDFEKKLFSENTNL